MSTPPPKWVMECQKCETSLTILYTPHNPNQPDEAIKEHLAKVMRAHLKAEGKPLPRNLKAWARKVRPIDYGRSAPHRRRRTHEMRVPA